tara:strand:- start:57 stop:629 length:573 start_codon:yes stop_codon:yes gene_type:complete
MKINKLSRKKKGGVGKSLKSKKTAIKASTTKKKPKLSSNNDERYIYITKKRKISFPYGSFQRAFYGYTKADLEVLDDHQINQVYIDWRKYESERRRSLRYGRTPKSKKTPKYRESYDSPVDFAVSPTQKGDININEPPVGFTPIKLPPPLPDKAYTSDSELFPPIQEELGSKQIADINDLIAELEKNVSK